MSDYETEVLALAPLGYWRLGEAAGTNAADLGSGANDGTYQNTPTLGVTGPMTGDADTAVTFDGVSEDVNMGDVLPTDHDEPFSVSFWFKRPSTTAYEAIISKILDSGTKRGWAVYMDTTGAIEFNLTNTSVSADIVVSSTPNYDDDVWRHCVVTYTGSGIASGVRIYINGSSVARTTVRDVLSSGTTVSAADLCIASRNSADLYFDGEVDEAAVFDFALDGFDARRLYVTGIGFFDPYPKEVMASGPTGYWRLGEAAGTDCFDETGSYDGTYTNTPTLAVTGALVAGGDSDTCVSFDKASSEYVTMGNVINVSYQQPWTFMAWVKGAVSGADAVILSKKSTILDDDGYTFSRTPAGRLRVESRRTDSDWIELESSNTGLGDDEWHFVVAVYVGGGSEDNLEMYIDGELDVGGARDGLNIVGGLTTTKPFCIGARDGSDQFADMEIDEVAVFMYALSAAQISVIYSKADAGNIVESFSLGASIGVSSFGVSIDSMSFAEVLFVFWHEFAIESFNLEVGLGLITTISDALGTDDSTATVRNQIGAVIEAVQFALTENIEHAKGVMEGLALNEAWAANSILQGNIGDTLNIAEVIQLTWDQLQTETMNITDTNSVYAQRGAALVELLAAAGIVTNIHKAAGIIAEAMIIQDLAERYFELSATDSVTMSDTDLAKYRAVAENIEAAVMEDVLSGTRHMSLLISDELVGTDTTAIAQRLRAALEDNAVFGGTIVLPDGVFSAIVLNTESLGISEYTNYPFNSFGKLGNDYLGASDTNIYQLTGDDDAGTDIDAVIRTGMTNFGTNVFKRVPRAYLGYTSDGGMIMKTISTSGGVKTERWYELTPRTGDHASDAHAAARIKLGRGIKATYWQFELINKLGSDFDIDTLQLYPMILSRRV